MAAATWIVVTDWSLVLFVNPGQFSLGWSTGRGLLLVAVTTLVIFQSLATQAGASHPLEDNAEKRRLNFDGSSASSERDLARRRRTDATLVDSERQFHSLARNVSGVVYQLRVSPGREYVLEYLSPKADEIFGVTPSLRGPTGEAWVC